MSMTPENPATTWRDLADQLTPQQVADIEYCERQQIPPGLTSPEHRLNYARKLIEGNIAQAVYADVAPPAGTHVLGGWEGGGDDTGIVVRVVSTDAKRVDATNILVSLIAVQRPDGSIVSESGVDEPLVHVDELDQDGDSCERFTINVGGARNLARALTAAADQLDGWSAR